MRGHEGQRGARYRSTISSTSALDGVASHAPALLPGNRPGAHSRLDGRQSRYEWVQKISHLLGINPRTVQSVASHYTD